MNDGGTGARWCCLVCHREHAEAACLKEEIATLTHERDEARAEVERLRGALDASQAMLAMFGELASGAKPAQEAFNAVADRYNAALAPAKAAEPLTSVIPSKPMTRAERRIALERISPTPRVEEDEPPAPQPDGEKDEPEPDFEPAPRLGWEERQRIAQAEARVWEEAIRILDEYFGRDEWSIYSSRALPAIRDTFRARVQVPR